MIRFIAAIDDKYGIADDNGIPWQGKIPGDVDYYHRKITSGGTILMGYGLYLVLSKPYPGGINHVASRKDEELSEGFELVKDARKFQIETQGDIWNLGGAGLYASTIDQADELYLTRVNGDYNCTKFFPRFEDKFVLKSREEPASENGITYHFEVWVRKI